MRLATVLTPESDLHLRLAAQCGVTDMVTRYPGIDPDVLFRRQELFARFGLNLSVVEGYLPIENIKLGQDDGTEMDAMKKLIQNMGRAQIPLLCYNFMSGTDWVRTTLNAFERGGARVTAFDLRDAERAVLLNQSERQSPTHLSGIDHEQLWANLTAMLQELVPIAEESGVILAMHPDDPPLTQFCGRARIMNCVESFERLVALFPSPSNAICFCQGTFAEMGVCIPTTIRRLGHHIRYVHCRDVRGTAESFTETFHDNGPTDMTEAMRAYRAIGFDGPIRPDHVPQLEGEDDGEPGYTILGRLFAWGYLRGLIQATDS